ncbi:MAG: NfeD family protein [Clostridia bacterium]|nr:NfeD family protein [Clostridia bacterium]
MQEYAIFWIMLAVVFGIIEACTANLTTVWMAIAAMLVAVFAALGMGAAAQPIAFVAIAAVLVVLTRPLAKRVLGKKAVATNADRIISQKGIVTEKIDPIENSGRVKVMGQSWAAKSESGEAIAEGTEVTVKRLEGVSAVVEPVKVRQIV